MASSNAAVTQGLSPEDDYGLDAIAQHNAQQSTEQFPSYEDDSKGLGIYPNSYGYQEDPSHVNNPPTPRSNTASDGVRTRSGRSTRRTDSPFSTSKSTRVSKSPAARSKKSKAKSDKLDKSKTPKLTAPLSVLTKDMDVPMKDIDAWVNRPADVRQKEVEKRNGYVTRPMNSFMLYRSAYAERTKQWCLQNNHQVVSSVSGESWPMEPKEVKDQFNEWAKIERANHQAAHPDYKFSPSKTNKRRKGDFSDDEAEGSDLDHDPDGEYRAGGRSVRQRRQVEQMDPAAYLPSNVGFGGANPYYDQQAAGYEAGQYAGGYVQHGRPLPSNVAYDGNGNPYNPSTGAHIQNALQQHPQYSYGQAVRVPTPQFLNGAQTIGGYGLPGNQHMPEEIFPGSRTGTPAMYNQYGQQVYAPVPYQPQQQQYAVHPQYQQVVPQPAYEHQQYLQAASQPQVEIDPGLDVQFGTSGHGETHFDDAIGDLSGIAEYFQESTSPNQTLAPGWESGEALGQ